MPREGSYVEEMNNAVFGDSNTHRQNSGWKGARPRGIRRGDGAEPQGWKAAIPRGTRRGDGVQLGMPAPAAQPAEQQPAEPQEIEHETLRKATQADNRMEVFLEQMESDKTIRHSSFSSFLRRKNSAEYNGVRDALRATVQATSGTFGSVKEDNVRQLENAANSYFRLIDACSAYIKKIQDKGGGTTSSGQARLERVQMIQKLAQDDIIAVQQYRYDVRNGLLSEEQQQGITWRQILFSAREASIEVDDLHNDEHFKALGANIKTGEGASRLLQAGIFTKEDIMKIEASGCINNQAALGNSRAVGNFGKTTNITNRNVATSRIAGLLGLGGIVEDSRTVKVKDKKTGTIYRGNLMSRAKGEEAEKFVQETAQTISQKTNNIERRAQDVTAMLAPTVQKELCSLQVLDFICGQGDRHRHNFFLEKDEQGRVAHVHGIDNDMSFASGIDFAKDIEQYGDEGLKMRVVVGTNGELVIPYMDRQLAQNILDLDENEIEFALKDLLAPGFIDATKKRFKMVQDAIRKEEGGLDSPRFIRDDQGWNEETALQMMRKTPMMKYKETHQKPKKEKGKENDAYFEARPNSHDLLFKSGPEAFRGMEAYGENTYFGEMMVMAMGYIADVENSDGNKFIKADIEE